MVWRWWYLSAVGVRVGVGHVVGHVAVVLVIGRTSPAPLLVHVGVVCVRWGHCVEMVGGIVCGGCLSRTWAVAG